MQSDDLRQQRRTAAGPRSAPLGSRLQLVAAARGPGRPSLRRCLQGGLDCLTSARTRGQGGRSGLRARWRMPSVRYYYYYYYNYILQPWTRPQRHEGTKDAQRDPMGLQLCHLCMLPTAPPGSRRTMIAAGALDPCERIIGPYIENRSFNELARIRNANI